MPAFRAFGRSVVVLLAVTVACAALAGLTLSALTSNADAAPYPPTEPCSLTATARGAAAAGGTSEYDVVASGLGATQPVRVVLATTGQQVGSGQTDSSGGFRTTITAPPDADASAPDLTASSPQRTCTWTPPAPPAPTRAPSSPGRPTGPDGPTTGDGGATSSGASPGGPAPSDGPTGPATGNPTSGGTSGGGSSATPSGSRSSSASGPSASSTPPLAEPSPGTETPFGIGLGIAAVLLVLGTLAVLLLTRRPEH